MPDVAHDLLLYFGFMVAATSILSLPLAPATLLIAKTASPLLVATLAAFATLFSSAFDYHFVRRAFRLRALQRIRALAIFGKAERWAKVAPFFTTLLFAAVPLPYSVVRVLMPLSGYPLARYMAAVALGRFMRIFVIAAFGMVVDVPNWILLSLLGLGVLGAMLGALARKLGWLDGDQQAEAPAHAKMQDEARDDRATHAPRPSP